MNNNDWSNIFPEVPQSFHETVQRTLNSQILNKTERKKVMKKRFPIVLAAVIAALGVTAAAAAYIIQWNDKLAERFGVNEQQQNQLAENGAVADVNQTVTENGVTISAVQTLGDKQGVYVLFDVKAPDGVVLPKDDSGISIDVQIEGATNHDKMYDGEHVSWSASWAESEGGAASGDYSEAPNERYYQLWLDNKYGMDLNGKAISVSFGGFHGVNQETGENVEVQGTWKMSWALSYMDQMKEFDINQSCTINGQKITVKSVQISPLSMTFELSGNGLEHLISDSDLNEAGGLCSASLVKKDGTTVNEDPRGERCSGNTYTQDIRFEQVQNPDEITGFVLTFYHEAKDNTATITLP